MIPSDRQAWARCLDRSAVWSAYAGGLALTFVALFTVASVVVGAFGSPILGDSEVVELVVGAAVACFMPLCQMRDGHVAITLFTDAAPVPVSRSFEILAALLTLIVAVLLTWRMGVGGIDALYRGRMSMFLNLPSWWGYLAATIPSVLWVLTAFYKLVVQCQGIPPTGGARIG